MCIREFFPSFLPLNPRYNPVYMLDQPFSKNRILKFGGINFSIRKNIVVGPEKRAEYVFYRIARPILKFNYKVFKLFHRESPWTSPTSILFFEQNLNREHVGIEFGSGGSTIFFARRLKHLVSVEHDKAWYEKVKGRLESESISNVEYLFIPENNPGEVESPDFFKTFDLNPADLAVKKEYAHYFNVALNYPDQHFDFALVDGRARVECVLNTIPKLKKGGLLVLDNSERDRYQVLFRILRDWPCLNTTNGLTDTTIWIRPENS